MFGTLDGNIDALMYGEWAKLPMAWLRPIEYGFSTLLAEVLGDGLFDADGIWNGGVDLVDDLAGFLLCIVSNCLTEIIPFCAGPIPLGFAFVDVFIFDFSKDGCAANPGGTIEQNCSYCERKLLLVAVALFRINSAYCASISFVTPGMLPRPPNDIGIGKLLVVAFFFGRFVLAAFSGCMGSIGFKLGIGLFGIPLDVGIMLNDFGKSCGRLGLADGKSVHIFLGWGTIRAGLGFRFKSGCLRGFGGIIAGITDGCDVMFGVIDRLGVIVNWPLPTLITVDAPDL